MRAILLPSTFAFVALAVAPLAGASCHMCIVTDQLHHFLP